MNLLETLDFVKTKHAAQKRTHGEPYWNHLVRVYSYVTMCGRTDEDILKAALGHDLIEDTPTTYEEVALLFGKKSADLIKELTNDYSDHLEHSQKLIATRKHVEHMSYSAKLIKICDRYDNISDTHGWKPGRILRYCENTQVLLEALDPIPLEVLSLAHKIVDRVIYLREKYNCLHEKVRYVPDPSGNNDSSYICEKCNEEVPKSKRK